MHPLFKDFYTLILDTILPVRCVVCTKESSQPVCPECLRGCTPHLEQRCIVCHNTSPFGLTHAPCKTRLLPDRFLCAYSYTAQPMKNSIIAGKYNFVRGVFVTLGKQMATQIGPELDILAKDNTIICPLPLHTMRLRWRGFNQSAILAEQIAQQAELPVEQLLVRTRATKIQKDLHKKERLANVANCFAPAPNTDLQGKAVVLVDDVTTTGSTLLEATKTLKQHGVQTVWCLALAQD